MILSGRGQPVPLIATLLLAAFLLLPSMATIGMFVDGTMYAAISRNLSLGTGSMWSLHFSDGLFPVFREHPPLVFWLQSLFFRMLDDHYLTERAYDLAVLVITAIVMRALWLRLAAARGLDSLADYWWLPLLLWVVVPKWSWTYRNNVLESTLTVFCLLAVLVLLAGLRAQHVQRAVLFAGGAALATLLAFLSKGPVGLFVLAAPVLLIPATTHFDWRRVLVVLAVLLAGVAVMLGAVLAWPEAREMLGFYWQKQVTGRAGVSGVDTGMLIELAKKLVPMLLVLAVLRLWLWRDGQTGAWKKAGGPASAMLAIGLAASLPLLLGDLDSAHYLVPALPFFALGFGLLGAAMLNSGGTRVHAALERRAGRVFLSAAVIVAAIILIVSLGRLGEVRRNEEYHAFLAQIAGKTGELASVGIDIAIYNDWYLHAIAQRHYRLSLVPGINDAEWRITPAASTTADRYRATGIRNAYWALRRRVPE